MKVGLQLLARPVTLWIQTQSRFSSGLTLLQSDLYIQGLIRSKTLDPIITIPSCQLLSIDPEKRESRISSKILLGMQYSLPWSEVGIEPEFDIWSTKFCCFQVLPTNFQERLSELRKVIDLEIKAEGEHFLLCHHLHFQLFLHTCFIHPMWRDEAKLNSQSWTNSEVKLTLQIPGSKTSL